MNRVFLISDTHFGHANILKYEPCRSILGNTIEGHDECLIDNWNSVVNKKDTVWHLGDVLFGRSNLTILPRLNGIKNLVLGNHDSLVKEFCEYFNKVISSYNIRKGVILTHIPIHQNDRYTKNIHGHLHSKTINSTYHTCVSVEQINFKPIPLMELL